MTADRAQGVRRRTTKYDAKTDFVKKGYDKLLSYQLEDGGIYKDLLANYNTAIAVSALAAAENPAFKERIDRAVAYLKGLQWTRQVQVEHPDAAKRPQVEGRERPVLRRVGLRRAARGPAGPTCPTPR